jgi:hypothetical protein
MNEAPLEERPSRARRRFGCLTRIVLSIAGAVALIIVIGETFDQGEDARPPSDEVDAGQADVYPPGDLSYLEIDHIFVVRLQGDGPDEYVALYDVSPKQQQLDSGCRVRYDEAARLTNLPQLGGFTGALVEECEGLAAVWRVDGKFDAGAGYGDLDRFPTSINDAGHLIIDTGERTCTRSRGVPGLPPYDVQTCRGRPG